MLCYRSVWGDTEQATEGVKEMSKWLTRRRSSFTQMSSHLDHQRPPTVLAVRNVTPHSSSFHILLLCECLSPQQPLLRLLPSSPISPFLSSSCCFGFGEMRTRCCLLCRSQRWRKGVREGRSVGVLGGGMGALGEVSLLEWKAKDED